MMGIANNLFRLTPGCLKGAYALLTILLLLTTPISGYAEPRPKRPGDSPRTILGTKNIGPHDKLLAAFPGAQGFGSRTVGGSGRHLTIPSTTVYRVTSLAESGPGTLRACTLATGPRVCIFETSGRISLRERIEVTEPYLTVAGETAPAPGIVLSGAGLRIATHDVVIRHLELRVGDAPDGPKPTSRDGIAVTGGPQAAHHIILDHLSISWALDENVSTWAANVSDVTLSNSFVTEALHQSIHPDGPHSMGVLIGEESQRISIHHSLLAHNNDRNPRQKPDSSLEFINNVVYNWGGHSGWHVANPSDTDKTNKPTLLNFIGNVYKTGPDSPASAAIFANPPSERLRVFAHDNLGPTRQDAELDDWRIANLPEIPYRVTKPAFALSGITMKSADDILDYVLKHAGSRPAERNEVDQRIIKEVQSGTGSIRDCIAGCPRAVGGWPKLEERSRALVLPKNPNRDKDGDGYTNLEEWLHCYARKVENGSSEHC